MATYLRLECSSKEEFWTKRGQISQVFESNVIWWRSAIQALFRGIPWWAYALFFLSLLLVGVSLHPVVSWYQYLRAPWWMWLQDAALYLSIYLCSFRHSVVILRYPHETGRSRWLRTHSTQIIFLIMAALLGAVAKKASLITSGKRTEVLTQTRTPSSSTP